MTKRIRTQSPRYLYFVTANGDGLCVIKRLDTDSTPNADKIEALFDRVVKRKKDKRKADFSNSGLYVILHEILHFMEWFVLKDPDSDSNHNKQKEEARKHLERFEGLDFPFDWTKSDWGKWESETIDEFPVTHGKHYWYSSWW